jgi:hypothetical protein
MGMGFAYLVVCSHTTNTIELLSKSKQNESNRVFIIILVFNGMQSSAQSEILRKTSGNASEAIFINMDEFMRGVSASFVVKDNKDLLFITREVLYELEKLTLAIKNYYMIQNKIL